MYCTEICIHACTGLFKEAATFGAHAKALAAPAARDAQAHFAAPAEFGVPPRSAAPTPFGRLSRRAKPCNYQIDSQRKLLVLKYCFTFRVTAIVSDSIIRF